MATAEAHEPGTDAVPRKALAGITVRSLLLAVAFTVLASYWIDQAEIVTFFCQITESVPAIPAVAFLILLVVLTPFVRRIGERLALARREILVIYAFLTVATSMAGCGIARFFINTLPVLFYFDTPENNFAQYQQYIPDWWIPKDREIVRQLYEGSATGAIPWQPWLVPLAAWGLLYLAIWITQLGLTAMFRRQWSEKEKLSYPLLYLPLEVTDGIDSRSLVVDFFTNRIMWIGFAIAFFYNVTNIINAYNPGVICLGKYYNVGALFTERPLSALRPMTLHYRPEMIGFGYLVSTEVALSVWVFYAALKLEKLFATMGGYEIAGLPFAQEQAMGAYVSMFLLLVWVGRHHLADVFRKAFTGARDVRDDDEPMSYRLAVIAALGGFAMIIAWVGYAGMATWLAALYFGLILMVALVYARIRAEVGVPLIWMFPYYQTYKSIKFFLGSAPLYGGRSWQSATIFTTLVVMSRGYFPALQGYQVESYRLARETDTNQRHMTWVLISALLVGFYVAIWTHLRSYYQYGAGGLRALEGWGAGIAKQEYMALAGYALGHVPADTPRIIATVAGFVVATTLMGVRMVFLRFPLHPLAFCMTTSYGELIWGTFFIVWLVKTLVFKVGGMRAYRQLIPGFLGLAMGHFFTAGILYGLVGSYGGETMRRYGVWFG